MTGSIEQHRWDLLKVLAKQPSGHTGAVDGRRLTEWMKLSPDEVNDAVTILVEDRLVEWLRTKGSAPYTFSEVWITSRGRYELERAGTGLEDGSVSSHLMSRPPTPVGSPFGFSDADWEFVAERHAEGDTLSVVMGYQFESNHYDSKELTANIESMFRTAMIEYGKLAGAAAVRLDFQPLAAGYGEHLFNEIARDIISADIAVFETSDLNPNVMIEMGVALTWGVRILPIKSVGCPKPPSDLSGQTWADHTDSGASFEDPDHDKKMVRMVERAIRKKSGSFVSRRGHG